MNKPFINKDFTNNKGIIVFDGYCVLCNKTVKFLIKIDKRKELLFTTLTSKLGQEITGEIPPGKESIVFVEEEQKFTKSDAVLRVLQAVGMPWSLLTILRIIPKFIRDSIYMLIANNRYKIFGKKDECMIPDKNVRDRFYL